MLRALTPALRPMLVALTPRGIHCAREPSPDPGLTDFTAIGRGRFRDSARFRVGPIGHSYVLTRRSPRFLAYVSRKARSDSPSPSPDRGEVDETRVGRGLARAVDAARGEGNEHRTERGGEGNRGTKATSIACHGGAK